MKTIETSGFDNFGRCSSLSFVETPLIILPEDFPQEYIT